ncbi:MAG TPA: C-GCAxxG-C-C family protein [Candidatus Butyricicoccus avistercoris]|uniref:C-GCAxxG-C-C family protein n=1 Tax=Candidatus Butyricicoccus avistercoris TaxID=2838518 RepID=A0A9D1PJY4_9FIRM|nr:C-GCAxxG-C-C family protein [Candidatus Butyricicoccus avistercoris]
MTKVEKAVSLHDKGYNCAQAVVCAFAEDFGLDEQTAYKMSEAFGLGVGQMEICGAVSGACMLAGMKNSGGLENIGKTKAETYKINRAIADEFKQMNESVICRELKGVQTGTVLRSCTGCIEDAVKIVEKYIK